MLAEDIVRLTDAKETVGSTSHLSRRIGRVTHRSEDASEDSVFVAIRGRRVNGESFLGEAYRLGCRVFVTEHICDVSRDSIQIIVNNTRKALAEISRAASGFPDKKLSVIGITGTKGKSTVAYILSRIINSSGKKCFSLGTSGLVDEEGKILSETENTTPEPTELYRLLSLCARHGAEVVCIEVSSQAIKQYRVFGVSFDAVIFTSLGVDHIGVGEHASFSEYAEAKHKLFTEYGAPLKILNGDDPNFYLISEGVEAPVLCGSSEKCKYRISKIKTSIFGTSFCLSRVSVVTPLPGEYSAMNLSLAIACACELFGISVSDGARAVKEASVPGRGEVYSVLGRVVVIDYAHNAMSFEGIMRLARSSCRGRLISVFGSVGGRTLARRRELAEVAERYCDLSYITEDDSRNEPREAVCREIFSFFSNPDRAMIIPSREDAMIRAISDADEGDFVLILGRGDEKTLVTPSGRLPLSDREVVKKIAEETKIQ